MRPFGNPRRGARLRLRRLPARPFPRTSYSLRACRTLWNRRAPRPSRAPMLIMRYITARPLQSLIEGQTTYPCTQSYEPSIPRSRPRSRGEHDRPSTILLYRIKYTYIFLARHSHTLPSQDISLDTFRISLDAANALRDFYTVLLEDTRKETIFPTIKSPSDFPSPIYSIVM